ncbi:MAG: hypothetical protein IJH65_03565 [Methanobrevibacter sp.]|nr:hypothetical protein [Methanobrevibacter sp.]
MTKAEEMIRDYNLKYNYRKNDYELSEVKVLKVKKPIELLFPLGIILVGVLYGRYKVRNKKDTSSK